MIIKYKNQQKSLKVIKAIVQPLNTINQQIFKEYLKKVM